MKIALSGASRTPGRFAVPMACARMLLAAALLPACAPRGFAAQNEPGFTSLFNGKDLAGWVVMGNPEGWRVVDGTLHSDGGKGGDWIRTDRQLANFVFRFDWMLSKVGNSGAVLYAGDKNANAWFEIQLLAPWTPYRDDLHCTASIYGYVPVSHRPDETTLRWRQMEITSRNRKVSISVDGQVSTEADLEKVPGLKDAPLRGYLGLQDSHTGPGEWVRFRNLRVKDLDQDPEVVTEGLRHANPAVRKVAADAAVRLGAPMVAPLCALLGEEDVALRRLAQGTLFGLVAAATAPDGGVRATAVSKALAAQVKGKAPGCARAYAAELLGIAGGGKEAVYRLAAALRDEDAYEAAKGALQRIAGPQATRALLGAVKALPSARRPGIALALGARRDPAAVKPLTALARAGDEALRAAALAALGQIGDPLAVPALQAAGKDASPAIRSAAAGALLALADGQRAQNRPAALRLYHAALTAGVNGGQKGAALLGLRECEDPDFLPALFAALADTEARAPAYALLKAMEGADVGQAVSERLKGATGWERAMLLRWSDERGVPGTEALLLDAAKGSDEPARAAALSLLGRRADPAHAALFLAAGKEGSEPIRAAALDGLLSVAEALQKKGEADRARELFRTALDAAAPGASDAPSGSGASDAPSGSDAARIRALAGLAVLPDPDSLPRIEALLGGAAREEAARACVACAGALAGAGKKDAAIAAYTKVLLLEPPVAAAATAGERLRALGVNRDFASELGFVTHWWLLGPFPNPKQSAYEQAYAPEKEVALDQEVEIAGQKLRWKPHHETKSLQGITELLEVLGDRQDVACYAYVEVTSDRERDVLIKVGSDDGMVVFLNGQRVGGTPELRPIKVDQDVLKAHLGAGANRIVVKVLQGSSRWAFCVRITDPDGKPLPRAISQRINGPMGQ